MSKKNTYLASIAIVFASVSSPASAVEQNAVIDTSKSFTMEFQRRPYTDPKNSPIETAQIDCKDVGVNSRTGAPYWSPDLLKPFDASPEYKVNKNNNPMAEGTFMSNHIGSMFNNDHQICIGHSQLMNANQKSLKKPFERVINGRTYKTSVPLDNDRYCAPLAAIKMCTLSTADDKTISPVYKIDPITHNVTIRRNEL